VYVINTNFNNCSIFIYPYPYGLLISFFTQGCLLVFSFSHVITLVCNFDKTIGHMPFWVVDWVYWYRDNLLLQADRWNVCDYCIPVKSYVLYLDDTADPWFSTSGYSVSQCQIWWLSVHLQGEQDMGILSAFFIVYGTGIHNYHFYIVVWICLFDTVHKQCLLQT